MAKNSQEQKARSEVAFQKKEERAREGEKATSEYDAAGRAEAEKTSRLKALRLAKEELDRQAAKPTQEKKRSRSKG